MPKLFLFQGSYYDAYSFVCVVLFVLFYLAVAKYSRDDILSLTLQNNLLLRGLDKNDSVLEDKLNLISDKIDLIKLRKN